MLDVVRLCLIRHGESAANADTSVYEDIPNEVIPLTELGRNQAGELADDLLTEIMKAQVDVKDVKIYSSPYLRAKETSEIILERLSDSVANHPLLQNNLILNPLIAEHCFGQAAGARCFEEWFEENQDERHLHNINGHLQFRCPRGESILDVLTRAGLFIERFCWFADSPFSIVSGHFGICAALEAYLLGGNPNYSEIWANCEARIFTLYPQKKKAHLLARLRKEESCESVIPMYKGGDD